MRGRRIHVGILVMLLAATSACAFGKNGSGSGGGKKQLALVSAQASISYYTTMNCGAQAAAKDYGVKVDYQAPRNFDATEQQQIIQSTQVKGVDGMVIVPADSNALNATLSQIAGKMPLITTDLAPSKKIGMATVTSDGFHGGQLAAQYMAKALTGKSGTVLVLANSPSITPVVQRAKGFTAGMAKLSPKVKALPIQYSGGDPSKASTIVGNTLRAHRDLVGVFASFEPSVFGTMSALNGNSRAKSITVVGYDGDPAEVSAVKSGQVAALVVQSPYEMGYNAVKQMSQVLDGSLKRSAITYQQTTPVVLATVDNLDSPEVARTLYRNKC